jgi:diguanylate cyclase (GGDEF)-like protein
MSDIVALEIDRRIEEGRALSTRDPAEALRILKSAIGLAERIGYEQGVARAVRARGMAFGALGEIGEAFSDFLIALDKSRSLGDRQLEAQCLHGLGVAFFHQGAFSKALEHLYLSIALRRETNDEKGLMHGLNSVGTINGSLGNYAEAVVNLAESLEIARNVEDVQMEGLALSNIAVFKLACDDISGALSDSEASVRCLDLMGDRVNLGNALSNYADAQLRQGELAAALELAERALDVARDLGNPYQEAAALRSLGLVLDSMGEAERAEDLLNFALQTAIDRDVQPKIAALHYEVGNFYLRHGDLERSHKILVEGLARAQASEQKKEMSDLHRALSELYVARGEFENALEAYKAHHDADRALEKQNAQNQALAHSARLEVDRARQQAEIHRLRNIDLADANRQKSDLLTRLQSQTDHLVRQATQDPLTGLYNRRYLNDFLETELRHAREAKSKLAVVLADLDDFKSVNDNCSHRIGDLVLQTMARLFEQNLRRQDVVARYGGDEFVVILPGASRKEAEALCERIRFAVETFRWSDLHPDLDSATVSLGVADGLMGRGDELLAIADSRLYVAKNAGKNQVA